MVEIGKLESDFLGVLICWIHSVVLISVLFDPIGDL